MFSLKGFRIFCKQTIKEKLPFMPNLYRICRYLYKDPLTYTLLERNTIYQLIFQLTWRCNSRCQVCFNWKKLNDSSTKELTVEEIDTFSQRMGKIRSVILGGGEPFLRNDLAEICSCFVKNNQIKDITIPTNCLLPHRIIKASSQILDKLPNVHLTLTLSLDGVGSVHDEIRGVPGNFTKVLETYERLRELQRNIHQDRLSIHVNTTISNLNEDSIGDLFRFVKDRLSGVSYDFEIIRGDYDSSQVRPPNSERYRKIIFKFLEIWATANNLDLGQKLAVYRHRLALKTIITGRQVIKCVAGPRTPVIDPMGNVYPCEILKPIGNLRDAGYHYETIWQSDKWQFLRSFISEGRCTCTHMCFLGSSISLNLKKSLLATIMGNFWKSFNKEDNLKGMIG